MAPRAKENVLVVEDDDTIRRLLIEYLTGKSHLQVAGARDGVEALHQISITRYRVIVLDLMMPLMTGVDFLSSLDALHKDPSAGKLHALPAVVVITGAPPEEIAREDLQRRFPLFVRHVLRKPLDLPRLGAHVLRILDPE